MASEYTINGMTAWLGLNRPTTAQTTLITIAADDAENTIRRIRQQAPEDPIESVYQTLAVEMGVYLYQKLGVDGTNSFTENGISRVYENGTFPESMLHRITPKACIAAFTKTVPNDTEDDDTEQEE